MNSPGFGIPSPISDKGPKEASLYPPTYRSYVKSLCLRYPSLLNLYDFLSNPFVPNHSSRLGAIDFQDGHGKPIIRKDLNIKKLSYELHGNTVRGMDAAGTSGEQMRGEILGRIFIIEDLTREVVELLGAELDIDPLFFSLHLHAARRTGMQQQTPDEATLPSRYISRDFTNISYHRSVTSDSVYPLGGRLLRDTVIDRKLVFLRSTRIGLAQHCTSIIRVKPEDDSDFWIAIILVDPAISDTYYIDGRKPDDQGKVYLQSRPFLGAYEDFSQPPSFSSFKNQADDCCRGGMMQDLLYYWSRNIPSCFDPKDPSLQSLAYYPLRIVAAEWVKYVAVMQYCIKQYEYQNDRLPELEKFNKDLRELQGWRRRSMNSQGKVRSILRLLQLEINAPNSQADTQDMRCLMEDFELISTRMEEAGRRLENMLPVVMTLVQIADARRSFAETADISRLTVLALVFVPLTFVASLFSMNTDIMPGSKDFWLYFAVAIPVTALVVVVARPPVAATKMALAWIKARRARPVPQRRPTFMMGTGKAPEA